MQTTANIPSTLTNLQLELLKLYALQLSNDDLIEVRRMLAKFFYKKMVESANKDWETKGYSPEIMDEFLKASAK
ncbi:MAG: hypothetical protein IT258_12010 [Saprospiraceae bacterium]|nr:hypothetical protein [Saprospiraceae bacterium]